MTERQRGILEMSAAMLISGSIGWLVLKTGLPVLEVVFWRCFIGSGALLALCLALGLMRQLPSGRRLLIAGIGGVAIVLNWVLLFGAYQYASIAVATAVYNIQPFILLCFGTLFFGERITLVKLGWLGLSFTGVIAIIFNRPSASYLDGGNYMLGIAMALLAALGWAIAAATTKKLKGVPPQLIALVHVITGSILLAPLVDWAALPENSMTWTYLAILGIVHTGVMYALMYAAVQRLPTDLQGALSFIYPVAAIMVDVTALGTTLHPIQSAGVAAIIIAAAGATLPAGSLANRFLPKTK